MQCRSLSLAAVRPDDDLDIMIESDQEPQKPFDRELPELTPKHLRDVRLRDTEQFPGLDLFQTTLPHDGIDLVHELRLDQVLLGIRYAQVLEDVPAPNLSFHLTHGPLPFAICSASRSRCSISSVSRRGVSRPVFDFFWNACST